ncbi:MAG: hypothetical protein ABI330_07860 [Caldimonas sp.]
MSDNIFFAVLLSSLLAAGTAAVGSNSSDVLPNGSTAGVSKVLWLPTVTVTGRRETQMATRLQVPQHRGERVFLNGHACG